MASNGRCIARYQSTSKVAEEIPEPRVDIPVPNHFHTAQELHLAGTHADQYRSPKDLPQTYWEKALERDPDYAPALIDLGTLHYKHGRFVEARELLERARSVLTRHNGNPRSGELFYTLGLILKAQGETDAAYDAFYKAAWNEAMRSRALTQLASIDGIRGNYITMEKHAQEALVHSADNPLAISLKILASLKTGNKDRAWEQIQLALQNDPLHLMVRYLKIRAEDGSVPDFVAELKTSPSQTSLDLAFEFTAAGFDDEAFELLSKLPANADPMVHYTLATLASKFGRRNEFQTALARGEATRAPHTYPFRLEEMAVLESIIDQAPQQTAKARYYLGCLLYDKRRYGEAASQWEKSLELETDFAPALRNLAVAYFSHLNRKPEVLPLLHKALSCNPGDEQLIYEIAYVMTKMGSLPAERLDFLDTHIDATATVRDDLILEWARAYNQAADPHAALSLLNGYHFAPCEGGEHAVV
ncbi:MAG: tetratricopeptide repeat protein, partial [Puniceicoccales bacterium]